MCDFSNQQINVRTMLGKCPPALKLSITPFYKTFADVSEAIFLFHYSVFDFKAE